MRKLDKILASPQARAALAEEGYNEAAVVLVSQDPSLGSTLYEAIRRATEQIKKAPMNEVQALSDDAQKLIMLRNLRRAIDDLATLAGVTL